MTKGSAYAPDRRALFGIVPALLLASTSSNILGPPNASQIYVLTASAAAAAAAAAPAPGPKVAWALSIGIPSASDSLDTDRIALMRSNTTMDYYANAQWPDRLPLMVQTALLENFENSGRITQVARNEDSLSVDYTLRSELRDFEARYDQPDGAPTVVVKITSRMVTAHGHNIASTFTTEQSVPASANSVNAVVEAFDTALAAAAAQIVNWALALPPPSSLPLSK